MNLRKGYAYSIDKQEQFQLDTEKKIVTVMSPDFYNWLWDQIRNNTVLWKNSDERDSLEYVGKDSLLVAFRFLLYQLRKDNIILFMNSNFDKDSSILSINSYSGKKTNTQLKMRKCNVNLDPLPLKCNYR